jgi:hypothetical protein
VPDDPHAVIGPRNAEGARSSGRADFGRSARPVLPQALGDRDRVDSLALTDGDLAKTAFELAVEEERQMLVDDERAVAPDLDENAGLR